MKTFFNFILAIFTNKKYFSLRYAFVLGFIIICIDCFARNEKLFNNYEDIILYPIAIFICGAITSAFAFSLADLFCETKMSDWLFKFQKNDFNKNDLSELIESLYINEKIDSITYKILKFVLLNSFFAGYDPMEKERKIEFLENIKNYIEKIKDKE